MEKKLKLASEGSEKEREPQMNTIQDRAGLCDEVRLLQKKIAQFKGSRSSSVLYEIYDLLAEIEKEKQKQMHDLLFNAGISVVWDPHSKNEESICGRLTCETREA